MLRRLALVVVLSTWPLSAMAQLATLIADNISFGINNDIVIAKGNVEILYDGQRVMAKKITYNRATDKLDIIGPITLIDEDGGILTGESAQLTRDFEQGVIRGARYIIDGQLQIASLEMHRVDGRYNQLYKSVASSCKICANNPTPLWRIRARRIVHDQVEKQIYYDDAFFEVVGIPILYFPRLRTPDPTLRRATGFLVPEFRNSSNLGIGLKFPYFITLGDHADVTLIPYVSAKTRTLETRLRKEFSFGSLVIDGAVSRDSLTTDDLRAYAFVEGRFRLPRDFKLNIDLRTVSDNAYLLAYDYSGVDRLGSSIEATRTRRDEHISVSFEKLRSLRAKEIPIEDTLATFLGRATYGRRFFPTALGGEARFVFDVEGHERAATTIDATTQAACVTANAPECVARDVIRAGILGSWQRSWNLNNGIISTVKGQVSADAYWIDQDTNFSSFLSYVTPTAAVELRWPWSRTSANGTTDIIEPVMQIAWTDSLGANVPNEDSKLVDFDEANMLSLSRFPGSDRYERGLRSTVGLNWTRMTASGEQYALTFGRVLRLNDLGQFTPSSGLDGISSDWLVAGQIKRKRLTLTNRSLFDESFSFSKSETQLAWQGEKFSATGSYIYVVRDPVAGLSGTTSELNFNTSYQFARHWTASVNGRYDGNTNKTTHAGFGLGYSNECVNVDFSLSHRFTSANNVEATTDYGLKVTLNGFGNGARGPARSCQGNG